MKISVINSIMFAIINFIRPCRVCEVYNYFQSGCIKPWISGFFLRELPEYCHCLLIRGKDLYQT